MAVLRFLDGAFAGMTMAVPDAVVEGKDDAGFRAWCRERGVEAPPTLRPVPQSRWSDPDVPEFTVSSD